jgi:hypothetical protein
MTSEPTFRGHYLLRHQGPESVNYLKRLVVRKYLPEVSIVAAATNGISVGRGGGRKNCNGIFKLRR